MTGSEIPTASLSPSTTSQPRQTGMSSWQRKYHRAGLLFVLPAVTIYLVMIAYPIIRSFYLSFFDYSILEPDSSKFVGLANYAKVFLQEQNRDPFRNTLYFTVLFVPFYVFGAMFVAMMLNAVRRGKVFLRTMIFAPVVVSLAVSSVMFTLFYDTSFGMAQKMLQGWAAAINHPVHFALTFVVATIALAAIAPNICFWAWLGRNARMPDGARSKIIFIAIVVSFLACIIGWTFCSNELLSWTQAFWAKVNLQPTVLDVAAAPKDGLLGDKNWTMPSIAALCLWNGIGFNIILFLVGLQRIPDELYEAGMVDGAGAWSRLVHITLPQLRPTIYLVLLLSMIGSFKLFGQPYIMTGGGPEESTLSYVMRLYNLAFKYGKFELGYASSLAYALAMFILVFSLLMRRLNKPVE